VPGCTFSAVGDPSTEPDAIVDPSVGVPPETVGGAVTANATSLTMLNVDVPEAMPLDTAEIVTEPFVLAVTDREATPPVAFAVVGSPPSAPLPEVCTKVIGLVSVVHRLSNVSRTSTVSVRAAPTARSAVELVNVR
jgi:hypothetical protein